MAVSTPAANAAEKPVPKSTGPQSTLAEAARFDLWIADGKFVWNGKEFEPTLGNVVDALRDRHDGQANFVLAPGLAKLKVSDVKLRGGRLADQLEAIRIASGSKFEWLAPGAVGPNLRAGTGQIDPTTGMLLPVPDQEEGLYVLREPAPTAETELTVEAFNLSGYLDWLSNQQEQKEDREARDRMMQKGLSEVELTVLNTIQSFKRDARDQDMPAFQFHRGTHLLVVIGTMESVEIVRKVVSALPGQMEREVVQRGARGYGGPGMPGAGSENEAFMRRYGLPAFATPPAAPGAPAAPTPRR